MASRTPVERRLEKLTSLLDVAKAMAAARDLDTLLPIITQEATEAAEADRCTLFVLDRERNELWSRVAQGERSVIRVPVGSGLAGTVAKTGETINIADAYSDPRFNATVDKATGYVTKTVLCVPMRDAAGVITGVLQALNKKDGTAFTEEEEEILLALGGQAAGAIENALLHDEINRLFEGFVSAAVVAIEARDPTTAGHSGRVASLTIELAKASEYVGTTKYGTLRFSPEELQELRYASLLHDFGKVGVREPVLVKANKLHPHELDVMRVRFELARRDRQIQSARRQIAALQRGQPLVDEEARLAQELRQLDEALEFVMTCNRPTILAEGGFEKLGSIAGMGFFDSSESHRDLLTPEEVKSLSIPRGSLSAAERSEIESHVTHTFRFLKQIPWTKPLRRVPEIAYAHHERADGKGYPRSLLASDIPVQSKMMAISDVYDALTASDRPYKKAVPHVQALDIIAKEAKQGLLDADLFQIFLEADVVKKALGGGK